MNNGIQNKLECDALIIGAGVIGLAIGSRIAKDRTTILVEAHPQFGQETSSRNSEVIHSGIYYPPHSNKTRWCREGRERLYSFAKQYNIFCRAVGKLLVTIHPEEETYLNNLALHSTALGIPYERLDKKAIQKLEPLAKVHGALFFPKSGIIDSHQLMTILEKLFVENGGMLAYRHRAQTIKRSSKKEWQIEIDSPNGLLEIKTPYVINAAGLGAAELSNLALQTQRYEHQYCRGRYFLLSTKYQNLFQHLIYPVPQKDGLGVHITIDKEGYIRLGPDADWCDTKSYAQTKNLYDCDWEGLATSFVTAANRYCPTIKAKDLTPGQIGIRPKLFVDATAHPDFLVENCDGFIHCLGIESPGLTACLPIANEVARLMEMS